MNREASNLLSFIALVLFCIAALTVLSLASNSVWTLDANGNIARSLK